MDFTALFPRDPISIIHQPAGRKWLSSFTDDKTNDKEQKHMQELQQTTAAIHQQVPDTARKKNEAGRSHNKTNLACNVNLEIGDFVSSGNVP